MELPDPDYIEPSSTKSRSSPCAVGFAILSFLCLIAVGIAAIWVSLQACNVNGNDGLGCAAGSAYRYALEMQRTTNAWTGDVTTHYCNGNVYQCSGQGSYGVQCNGQTVVCTWPLGCAPPNTTLQESHRIIALWPSAANGFTPNLCVLDDQPRVDAMLSMQKTATALWAVFCVLVVISVVALFLI